MTSAPLVLPGSTVPDPRSAPAVRWAIVSPGSIAEQFTGTLHRATASRAVAVASRSQDRADDFARRHGIDHAYGDLGEMLEAGGFDIVYIASPHAQHHALARQVLEAGFPALVEKAFTLNADQARDLIELARSKDLLLMEAMWSRFLPRYDVLREVLAEGLIGEVVSMRASHGQAFPFDPEHRLYNPELGGGALLDLGIYPLSFAQMLLGDLTDLQVAGSRTATGVDETVHVLAAGASGPALIDTTLRARTPNDAAITGTLGRILLPETFYTPGRVVVELDDGRSASSEEPENPDDGMAYEAAEAARCLDAGLLESPLMPWKDTLSLMRTMDEIRAALGVAYPGEEPVS